MMEIFHAYAAELLSSATLAGVAWIVRGVQRINAHLAQLNGRLGKVEEWSRGHERLDDERHRMVIDRIDEGRLR
jgi:hypothetical protein